MSLMGTVTGRAVVLAHGGKSRQRAEPTLSILALTGLKPLIPGEPTAGPVAVASPSGEPEGAHYALAGFSLQISGFAREGARGGCKAIPHPPRAPRRPPDGARGAGGAPCPVRQASRRDGYFFFGAIIMTICRPSRRGRDSITMSSPRSASIRPAIWRPSSWWLISRPRKRMLTLTLSPSSRKRRMLRSLIW